VPPPGQVNPGAIESESRRQQERLEQQTQPQKQQGPAVISAKRQQSPLLRPGGPKFLLKAVKFTESKFLSSEELDAITSKYIGKQIDFSELQALVAAVIDLYHQKGIVTGIATLPPQKVEGGTVTIQLTEGRRGRVSIDGNIQTSTQYILDRVRLPPEGEVLDVPQLTSDVTWFNRTNDAQIRILLQPGSSFGLTDVQLAVKEPAINSLQVFADNQGVKSTGANQIGSYYRHHGLLGVDDVFTFYGTKSEGNINGNVAFNVPVNAFGGRLGVSYTQGAIRIVNGPFETLDVKGGAKSGAVNFSQPLWADQEWLLLANFSGMRSASQSVISDITTVDDMTWKRTSGFSLSNYGSFYTATASFAANAVDSHSRVTQLDRAFYTYTGMVSGLAKLPAAISISILGNGQYSRERLLPGDQLFQIGGPTTVRGFPTNTVAGDSGYYTNLELHRDWSDLVKGLDTYLFHDFGEVFSTSPRVTTLRSIGAGLSWNMVPSLTLEASFGVPCTEVVVDQPKIQGYARVIFRPLQLFP
jgi:hemolysin activation/secretion protein